MAASLALFSFSMEQELLNKLSGINLLRSKKEADPGWALCPFLRTEEGTLIPKGLSSSSPHYIVVSIKDITKNSCVSYTSWTITVTTAFQLYYNTEKKKTNQLYILSKRDIEVGTSPHHTHTQTHRWLLPYLAPWHLGGVREPKQHISTRLKESQTSNCIKWARHHFQTWITQMRYGGKSLSLTIMDYEQMLLTQLWTV